MMVRCVNTPLLRRNCVAPVSKDLTSILDGWQHEPDRFSVRIVPGDDGRDKIQVRLDLGILQMEIDGRPDGQQPEGLESWFDVFRTRQREHDTANPDGASFQLSPDDCQLLLREGVQYYHRYLSFWHLERYELCARDTSRNLKLFAFVQGVRQQGSGSAAVRSIPAVRDDDARQGRGHAARSAAAIRCRHSGDQRRHLRPSKNFCRSTAKAIGPIAAAN